LKSIASAPGKVILLLMEHKIALTPYTTKCSPKRITFPGADALDFN
jgi:hypothetical protein